MKFFCIFWSILVENVFESVICIMSNILFSPQCVNSLTPGGFVKKIRFVIFKLILVTNGWGIYCEIALRWISMNPTEDMSILVQVMAWCRQATSHYLSECWPRSLSPYGVTRPQWVKIWTEEMQVLPHSMNDDACMPKYGWVVNNLNKAYSLQGHVKDSENTFDFKISISIHSGEVKLSSNVDLLVNIGSS